MARIQLARQQAAQAGIQNPQAQQAAAAAAVIPQRPPSFWKRTSMWWTGSRQFTGVGLDPNYRGPLDPAEVARITREFASQVRGPGGRLEIGPKKASPWWSVQYVMDRLGVGFLMQRGVENRDQIFAKVLRDGVKPFLALPQDSKLWLMGNGVPGQRPVDSPTQVLARFGATSPEYQALQAWAKGARQMQTDLVGIRKLTTAQNLPDYFPSAPADPALQRSLMDIKSLPTEFHAGFQRHRTGGAMQYEMNPDWLLVNYIRKYADMMALEPAYLQSVARANAVPGSPQTGIKGQAHKYIEGLLGTGTGALTYRGGIHEAILNNLGAVVYSGMIAGPGSAIQNSQQHLYTMAMTGVRRWARGFGKALTGKGIEEARAAGVIDPWEVESLRAVREIGATSKPQRIFNSVLDATMWLFKTTETNNRVTAYHAGIFQFNDEVLPQLRTGMDAWSPKLKMPHMYYDVEQSVRGLLAQGKPAAAAVEYGRYVALASQGGYGKTYAPDVFRQRGPITRAITQFMQYDQIRAEFFVRAIKQGDLKSVGAMLVGTAGAYAFMHGVLGLDPRNWLGLYPPTPFRGLPPIAQAIEKVGEIVQATQQGRYRDRERLANDLVRLAGQGLLPAGRFGGKLIDFAKAAANNFDVPANAIRPRIVTSAREQLLNLFDLTTAEKSQKRGVIAETRWEAERQSAAKAEAVRAHVYEGLPAAEALRRGGWTNPRDFIEAVRREQEQRGMTREERTLRGFGAERFNRARQLMPEPIGPPMLPRRR